MRERKRGLPVGWYPDTLSEVEEFIHLHSSKTSFAPAKRGTALASVAPHAGWFFSGSIALISHCALDPQADTVVIAGGHLGTLDPPLAAMEDRLQTPGGYLEIDGEFRDAILKEVPLREDRYNDNTVEVQLPFVEALFPRSKIVWLRLPVNRDSFEIGKTIRRLGKTLGRRTVFLGSTDLTHYGPNYNFTPRGTAGDALDWVRTVNDRAFIDAVCSGAPDEVIRRALQDYSACSAGAVLGALGFSFQDTNKKGTLLAYGTSADVRMAESFVGYGALAWL